jgi:hypothetical protein
MDKKNLRRYIKYGGIIEKIYKYLIIGIKIYRFEV